MKKEDINCLNKFIPEINCLIENFIDSDDFGSVTDFVLVNKLSEIIEKYPKRVKLYKFNNKLAIRKSLSYSYKFLKTLKYEYAAEVCDNIFFENTEGVAFTDYYREEDEKIIYIPYNNTILDTYMITHEAIHATNIRKENSLSFNYFGETLSLYAERLQRDFLKSLHIKDCDMNEIYNHILLTESNAIYTFQNMLLIEFLKKGYISYFDIKEFLLSIDELKIEAIYLNIKENIKEEYFDIYCSSRYVIAYPLSSYLYYNIAKEQFVELNDCLCNFSISNVFNYLNLYLKKQSFLDLTDDSYKKIEESYKKKIKSLF